jgi:NAD/NADP transhydrogenase alpha subunit
MKVLKKIISFVSLALLLAGVILILYTYLTNHTFVQKLTSLLTNADCKRGMLMILIGFICLVFSFVLFSVSVRLGAGIRRKEREMAAAEKAKLAEEEERNRRLEQEAAAAKAEAERFKAEATQAHALLQSSVTAPEAEEAQTPSETM